MAKTKIEREYLKLEKAYKFIENNMFPQTGIFYSIPCGDSIHTKKCDVKKYDTKAFVKRNFPYNTSDIKWNKGMIMKMLNSDQMLEQMQDAGVFEKDVIRIVNDDEVFDGIIKDYQTKVARFIIEQTAWNSWPDGSESDFREHVYTTSMDMMKKVKMEPNDIAFQLASNEDYIREVCDAAIN